MNGGTSAATLEEAASDQQRLARCLTIVAKNVPMSDALLEQLADCELIAGQTDYGGGGGSDADRKMTAGRSAKGVLNRRQSEQHLFASMATLELARLQQLANCLRIAGHPLMAELLLQTVSSCKDKDDSTAEPTEALLFGTGPLPTSIAERLADSPEAQADIADLLSERRLLVWCRDSLFDPAGADVMSLRKQHAEESWRAAREVREKTASVVELQAKLSAAQAALTDRDETIAQLESRLSTLAAAAGDADAVDELKLQMEVSRRHQTASESQAQRATARIEAYCAAFDFILSETRKFESEAADLLPSMLLSSDSKTATATNGSFVKTLQEELDEAHRLASFQTEFSERFLTACRAMLEERRQLVQLAENIAASDNSNGGSRDLEFDTRQPLASELSRLISRQSEENSLLTARHRLLLTVLDDASIQSATDSAADDELVAAVGSLRLQLAERDRRIASLTRASAAATAAVESPSPPPQPPRRSAAVTRAWDEITPEAAGNSTDLKRFSVLPEIQSASSNGQTRRQSSSTSAGAAVAIPHSHRKATKRESNAKKREPPGKPLPANVVSLT